MSGETETDIPEAPLPPGVQKVSLEGRDPRLPEVYLIPSHSLARNAKGKIYLLVYDWRKEAMAQLLQYAAKMTAPGDPEESLARGFLILHPSGDHRVIARNRFGSGKEEEDRIVTFSKSERPDDQLSALRRSRDKLIGNREELTSEKAILLPTGEFFGGINFERSFRSVPNSNGDRCYGISTTIQIQKLAPSACSKVFDIQDDKDLAIRYELLKLGSTASTACVEKGPKELLQILKTQAKFSNMPCIGIDANAVHPGFQLNVVSAKEHGGHRGVIAELGTFGKGHLDGETRRQ